MQTEPVISISPPVLNLTAIDTLPFTLSISPDANDVTRLGIIDEAIAVDTATGTLTSSLYFVLYIPCIVLTTLSETPFIPITPLKRVTSTIPLNW